MAVITEINGVSTSGTTGVNNIFGSGTGGSSSPSATPVVTLTTATTNNETYAGAGAFINVASFAYPAVEVEVLQSDGTNITPTVADLSYSYIGGILLVQWEDTTTYFGQYTVNVRAIDMGASPAEIPSAVVTNTYNRVAPQFKYYRIQACLANGAPDKDDIAISDIQLFTSSNALGTQVTGTNSAVGNTTEHLSSNTGDSFDASAGFTFSSYQPWKAFDNSANNIGSAWWTLTNSNAANNWIQLEFKTQAESANSDYATAADFPLVASVRVRTETNGSVAAYKIMGSNTGAFSGEEYVYGGGVIINHQGSYKTTNA